MLRDDRDPVADVDLALVLVVGQLQLRRAWQMLEVAVVKDNGLVVPRAKVLQAVQMLDQ